MVGRQAESLGQGCSRLGEASVTIAARICARERHFDPCLASQRADVVRIKRECAFEEVACARQVVERYPFVRPRHGLKIEIQ